MSIDLSNQEARLSTLLLRLESSKDLELPTPDGQWQGPAAALFSLGISALRADLEQAAESLRSARQATAWAVDSMPER